ncbi:MAG: flagellar basal body-associated FliL family protein [Solirubrobacteraceae bacterium]|jgi:flagellar FliL protein
MKPKILVPVLVAVLAAGGAYKFMLAEPEAKPKHKVEGEVYVMPREFLVNLADGRFARLNVALVFEHGYTASHAAEVAAKESGAGKKGAAKPVEGFGVLPQEPLLRDIITGSLASVRAGSLQRTEARERLKRKIGRRIAAKTDVKVEEVLFTDVAVQ